MFDYRNIQVWKSISYFHTFYQLNLMKTLKLRRVILLLSRLQSPFSLDSSLWSPGVKLLISVYSLAIKIQLVFIVLVLTIYQFRDLFRRLDKQETGTLHPLEFRAALESLNESNQFALSEPLIKRLISSAPRVEENAIDYEAFISSFHINQIN